MEKNTDRLGFALITLSVVAFFLLLFNGGFKTAADGLFSGLKSQIEKATGSVGHSISQTEISFANGGDVSAWAESPDDVLADVKSMNLNSVSIPVKVNISSTSGTDAAVDTQSLALAESMVALMNKNHINTIIEPYPYIANGTEAEVDINPTDKHAFMENWGSSVDTIAKSVSKYDNVTGLYIGSNFVNLEDQTADFDSLIDNLHSIFKGQIIYRTNWWYNATWDAATTEAFEKKKETPMFKKVDVLSIASYFEVTNDADIMSVPDLKVAMNNTSKNSRGQKIIDQIKELHEATGKPITFGELGITNYVGAMSQPYQMTFPTGTAQNDEIQSVWYTAWIETMRQYDWFKGYYVFGVGDTSSAFYPNSKTKATLYNLNK